jgi:hypothetical protein
MRTNPQFLAKKAADRISYLWDDLIGAFAKHILAGTSISPYGPFELKNAEASLRVMALESRFRRRAHAASIWDAIERAPAEQISNRVLFGMGDDLAYAFVQFPYRDFMKPNYEKYQEARRRYLLFYCTRVFARLAQVRRVVGIACEPPRHAGSPGGSEDVMYIERPDSDTPLPDDIAEFGESFEFGDSTMHKFHASEYPQTSAPPGASSGSASGLRRPRSNDKAKRRKKARAARAARKRSRRS